MRVTRQKRSTRKHENAMKTGRSRRRHEWGGKGSERKGKTSDSRGATSNSSFKSHKSHNTFNDAYRLQFYVLRLEKEMYNMVKILAITRAKSHSKTLLGFKKKIPRRGLKNDVENKNTNVPPKRKDRRIGKNTSKIMKRTNKSDNARRANDSAV